MRQQKVHWQPSYNQPPRNRRSSDQKRWSSTLVTWLKLLASSLLLILIVLYVGIVLYAVLPS